jgi:Protein of unknown function (DUF6044)
MKEKTFPTLAFRICLGLLLIPYLAWYILGENSYVLNHDNLDGEFVYIKLLLQSGNVLGLDLQGEIPQVMNGIDRTLFRSGFNITFIFFELLPPVYAYITNHLVVHLIGFLGMFWLLRRHFTQDNGWLVPVVALCFGWVSYYHLQYGISIAGQPLLLFAFLNLLKRQQKWYDWLIIVIFPFFSFLIVTLPFFLPLLLVTAFFHYRKTKQIPWVFFGGLALLCVVNALVEFNLIYSTFLVHDAVSHRTEWDRLAIYGQPNFKLFLYYIYVDLQHTQYHAGTMYTLPIVLGLIIAKLAFKIKLTGPIKLVGSMILFIACWDAFNLTLLKLMRGVLPLVEYFSTERFFFIAPFLWVLLMGLVLKELDLAKPLQRYFAMLVVGTTLVGAVVNNREMVDNAALLVGRKIEEPTFKQFFAEDLFGQMKDVIGTENVARYNTLSIGSTPSVAQYNGFKTLDGYQNNFELSYKHAFRKIIGPELEKDKNIKTLFDNMGSTCYAFSAELGTGVVIHKDAGKVVKNLDLNFAQMREMGGKYIIAGVPIENHDAIGLHFVQSFSSPESFYELFLYEI